MTAGLATMHCAVCGFEAVHEPALDGLVRRCGRCTFVWTARELPPSDELYDGGYFQGDGYPDYFLPRPRRFEASRRLRWLLGVARPASLVEAGCAGGFFVEAARRAGIAASGVEISGAAVRYARERLGVPVAEGRFEAVRLGEPVGAVCAFHVLEHVEDPHAFVRAAFDVLEPGGWLALEVPNIAGAAARRLGTAWPHLDLRYHRWHFTPSSLAQLVSAHGFRAVAQDTVYSRFYWQPLARIAHARSLLVADWVAGRSPRVSHPTQGDALRLVARKPGRRPVR